MGANNSSLTPLNCILKNWDRFDPQGLKKTHLVFLCDTAWPRYPLEDGERWPVGGSLKYNTVLQLDRFCKEQGKWVEVAYVLPFFSLQNMPDLCPKGIDLGVKPSAPSCPLTLPPCWGLQTGIQTAHMEVQTTPVSVQPQTTLVSVETQTIEVRDEMEDRRQREEEKQVSPIYPWNHMLRAAKETEEQPHKLLPLYETPTGRNNQSVRVNKPFSYQEIQRIKEDLGDYLEDPEKYIRAFKGVTLLYDLTWKDVMYILRQTLTPESKTRVLGKAVAYGDEWLGNESVGKRENEIAALPTENQAVPTIEPDWDYNTAKGRWDQSHFVRCILEGLRQARSKPLNYGKLADIEQEEKEAPGKFLDRLREGLRRFTEIDPESEEGKVILKDRFLTQSAPDIRRKLLKQAYGPNQSLDTLLQLAQTVYYGREYEEKKGKKKTKEKAEAFAMAMKNVLKQPEKSAQRGPGEKRWACYYCGKEGHLKRDCPQASKPPPAPCPVCKGPHWKRDCPQRRRSPGSDSQDNQD